MGRMLGGQAIMAGQSLGRVPINSILAFIIRTYKKVGFGRLR